MSHDMDKKAFDEFLQDLLQNIPEDQIEQFKADAAQAEAEAAQVTPTNDPKLTDAIFLTIMKFQAAKFGLPLGAVNPVYAISALVRVIGDFMEPLMRSPAGALIAQDMLERIPEAIENRMAQRIQDGTSRFPVKDTQAIAITKKKDGSHGIENL